MLCGCSCGQRTAIATRSDVARGLVKGQPLRFIHGHQSGTPRPKAAWSTSVVGYLVSEKRRGETDFNAAWRRAVKRFPPKGRDLGDAEPTLFPIEDGQQGHDVSLVEFTEFVAGQAWHDVVSADPGQGRALAKFRPDMLASANDSSEPAVRTFRTAAAA